MPSNALPILQRDRREMLRFWRTAALLVLVFLSPNLALAAANDTKALAAVVRSWKDLTVSDEKLKANRLPALAIVGDLDPLKKGVDDLKDRLAGVQIIVVENSDHMTAFAKPDFVKELKAFLVKNGNGKAE